MDSGQQEDAAAVAQSLLGSLAQQRLPPSVQVEHPIDPEVTPEPQVQTVPEVPQNDPLLRPEQDQSFAQSPPRHRLMSRLLRALPIASADQITAMLSVFDPNANAARDNRGQTT